MNTQRENSAIVRKDCTEFMKSLPDGELFDKLNELAESVELERCGKWYSIKNNPLGNFDPWQCKPSKAELCVVLGVRAKLITREITEGYFLNVQAHGICL